MPSTILYCQQGDIQSRISSSEHIKNVELSNACFKNSQLSFIPVTSAEVMRSILSNNF